VITRIAGPLALALPFAVANLALVLVVLAVYLIAGVIGGRVDPEVTSIANAALVLTACIAYFIACLLSLRGSEAVIRAWRGASS
jgi:hypothetical protein